MNKKQQLEKDYYSLWERYKKLENSYDTLGTMFILISILLVVVSSVILIEATEYTYNQGFQDGQNNTCNFDNVKANMTMNTKMELIINLQNTSDNSIKEVKKLNCSLLGFEDA